MHGLTVATIPSNILTNKVGGAPPFRKHVGGVDKNGQILLLGQCKSRIDSFGCSRAFSRIVHGSY